MAKKSYKPNMMKVIIFTTLGIACSLNTITFTIAGPIHIAVIFALLSVAFLVNVLLIIEPEVQ
jgi:hypothetical protein